MRTNPDICSLRVKQRNRDGEENIPIEYLEQVHKYHEKWLNVDGDITLNGNDTVEFNRERLFEYIDNLLK